MRKAKETKQLSIQELVDSLPLEVSVLIERSTDIKGNPVFYASNKRAGINPTIVGRGKTIQEAVESYVVKLKSEGFVK